MLHAYFLAPFSFFSFFCFFPNFNLKLGKIAKMKKKELGTPELGKKPKRARRSLMPHKAYLLAEPAVSFPFPPCFVGRLQREGGLTAKTHSYSFLFLFYFCFFSFLPNFNLKLGKMKKSKDRQWPAQSPLTLPPLFSFVLIKKRVVEGG